MTVNGTAGNDTITVTGTATNPMVTVNSLLPISIGDQHLRPGDQFGLGTDTVIVNSGAAPVTIPITYQGSLSDSLILEGGAVTSDTYVPGPVPGSGVSTLVFAGGTETVYFVGLSPVTDSVPAANLFVDGNSSNNAISYQAGTLPGTGLITVDNFEPITFSSKLDLTINGMAGDDTITVNTITIPTSLAVISVVGGGGNDTLVVNADNQLVSSADVTAAAVTIPIATPVAIGYSAISHVNIINSIDALTATPATINAGQDNQLIDALVASFRSPTSPRRS